jgi:hypothetical protein
LKHALPPILPASFVRFSLLFEQESPVILFAPLVHLHPSYLQPTVIDLADKTKFATEIKGVDLHSVLGASWDEAFISTKPRWDKEGLGKVEPSLLAASPLKVVPTRASNADLMNKRHYRMLDLAKKDPGVYERHAACPPA